MKKIIISILLFNSYFTFGKDYFINSIILKSGNTEIDSVLNNYGKYEFNVNFVKDYVKTLNPSLKDEPDLWVDVETNPKLWDKEDIKRLATNKYAFDVYEEISELADACEKKEGSLYTKDALQAQNALQELAPKNMSWRDFKGVLKDVTTENLKEIAITQFKSKVWVIDTAIQRLKKNGIEHIDSSKVMAFATSKNKVDNQIFRDFVLIVKSAYAKKPNGKFKEYSIYAQGKLSELCGNCNGDWTQIFNDVLVAEKATGTAERLIIDHYKK